MRLSQEAIQRMISGRSGSGGGGGSFDQSALAGYATQAWTEENYISKTFFNELFIVHKKVTTVVMDGETEISRTVTTNTVFAPNEIPSTTTETDEETGYVTTVTTEIASIESKKGFWTNYFLSALGLNGEGGGGGITLNEPLATINVSGLADHPSSSGQTIVWNGTAWVYGTAGGGTGTVTGVKVGDITYSPVNGIVSIPAYPTSLAWSAITSKPTTIAGYGITDAKIENGVITLGSNTITPLTSSAITDMATKTWVGQQGFITSSAISDMATKTWVSNNYLPRTGGDLTGNLAVMRDFDLSQPNNGISGTSNGYYGYYIKDSNNKRSVQYINTVSPQGYNSFWISVTYDVSGGSEKDHGFGLTVDKQGNCTWNISQPAAFRTAIDALSKTEINSYTWWGRALSNGVVNGDMTNVGNISFSASGKNIGGLMSFITAGNGTVGVGTLSPNTNYKLDVNGYTKTSRLYLSDTIYMVVQNDGIHIVGGGLYADTYVSALGLSENGSGTVVLNALLESLNSSGLSAHGSTNTTIVWNGSAWTFGTTGLDQTALTNYLSTKTLTVKYGNTTLGTWTPTAAGNIDISNAGFLTQSAADLRYLQLTGGVVGGQLKVSGNFWQPFVVNSLSDNTTNTCIQFAHGSDMTSYGGVLMDGVDGNLKRYNTSFTSYTIWDAGNDGAGSGLDADLLDGQHGSYYGKASDVTTLQGYFTNGSAKTALKLNTAVSLWGQSFDGSADVSGNMTGVGSITMSGSLNMSRSQYVSFKIGNDYTRALGIYQNTDVLSLGYYTATEKSFPTYVYGTEVRLFNGSNAGLVLNTSGNVGIGNTNPSYNLDVNGTVNCTSIRIGGILLTAQNNGIRVNSAGLYADTYVSALGLSDSGSGSTSALSDLVDVSISSASNGQGLAYENGLWKNKTLFTALSYANNTLSMTVSGVTKTVTIQGGSSGVTSITAGTGLSGGTITSSGTVAINSTYQTYISHGESAYNSLNSYLPLTGGTVTGQLKVSGNYMQPLVVNSLASNTPNTCIQFTHGSNMTTYGGIMMDAANGSLKRYDTSFNTYTLLDSGNTSITGNTVKINNVSLQVSSSYNLPCAGTFTSGYWHRLGNYVTGGDASNLVITIYDGTGYNGYAEQNSIARIVIKDGWQNTRAAENSVGVSIERSAYFFDLQVSVVATAHNAGALWVYLPWQYAQGTYTVEGVYTSWEHHNGTDGDTTTAPVTNQTLNTSSQHSYLYFDYAYLTSNVTSATKLKTTRYIWGNAFDGTANVSGSLNYVDSISFNTGLNGRSFYIDKNGTIQLNVSQMAGGWATAYSASNGSTNLGGFGFFGIDSSLSYIYVGTAYNNNWFTVMSNGNVGIGFTNPNSTPPSYKLHVNGEAMVANSIYTDGHLIMHAGSTGIYLNSSGTGIDWHNASNSYVSSLLAFNQTQVIVAASSGLRIGHAVLMYDSGNNALKVQHDNGGAVNFYALGGISALGMSGNTSGEVAGSLIPSTSDTYTLGSSSARWKALYLGYSSSRTLEIKPTSYDISFISSGSTQFAFNNNMEVSGDLYVNDHLGVGDTNTNYTLYVYGTAYITGNISAASVTNRSDMRLKDFVENINLSVESIAAAPSFKYTFKGDSRLMVGTSAQYWRGVLPETVFTEEDNMLSMDYGVTALASVISVARKVMTHEERIAALEAENERLRNEIETLKVA